MLSPYPEASSSRVSRHVLALLLILAGSALIFVVFYTPSGWLLGTLGYGLVPTIVWITIGGITVSYKPSFLLRYWGYFLAGVLAIVGTVGILSLFPAPNGVLNETGLGGQWGQAFIGDSLSWGVAKVVVAFLLVPASFAPNRTIRLYLLAVRNKVRLCRIVLLFLLRQIWNILRISARPIFSKNTTSDEIVDASEAIPKKLSTKIPKLRDVGFEVKKKINGLNNLSADNLGRGSPTRRFPRISKWGLPSNDLLDRMESHTVPEGVLNEMGRLIENTLSDHGVKVSVEDIKPGPRVVRFGLVPGWAKKFRENRETKVQDGDTSLAESSRVKVQSILAREQDLALALKTPDIRIEAPVPGEALVGLEVPNPFPSKVHMRSVVDAPGFRKITKSGGLPLGLGQGTGGEPIIEDLIELPHLLIAGATGSGKSVCINSIITSLLMTNPPDKLRLLMIDPKRVELTPFNGLPHLLCPVIVDSDEVLKVLSGMLQEMFRRYRLLEDAGVRNIDGYNRKSKDPLSYLVLIIDELADLMMAAAYDMEQALVRLAQLGRATGIHLILCTQRPSVNVVTGLLKANISSRIAFAVASQVDSRVILDGAGAEKLLGKGDMLLLSSESPKARRVQGTYLSDEEIERVVDFWKGQSGPPLPKISFDQTDDVDFRKDNETEDELLDRATEMVGKYNQVSPSLLQRKLQIGYPRALYLMQLLEEEGVIDVGDPGKSRAVLKDR